MINCLNDELIIEEKECGDVCKFKFVRHETNHK